VKKKKKGFTLIELLVVVAIIALLISILLPSLSRARELAKRSVCASNLRGIGQGQAIYANDNLEWFPHHYYSPNWNAADQSPSSHGVTYIGTMGSKVVRISQPTTPSTGSRTSHPSRSHFLLVIAGQSTTGQFLCPSSSDTEDDLRNRGADDKNNKEGAAQPGINRFDFRGYPYLSYGYQMPYGRRAKPRTTLDARMPISADKGPYFSSGSSDSNTQTTSDTKSGVRAPDISYFGGGGGEAVLKASNEKWRSYNSQNHNGEGQNVLFVDSHVEFLRRPISGVNNDNIYTYQVNWTDPNTSLLGEEPGRRDGLEAPLAQTDSLIVP
jgi:prepilin-type N-terminal cleavage/methylation domain-containing protein/prepilin-type processing-associated H-X9-DG protein